MIEIQHANGIYSIENEDDEKKKKSFTIEMVSMQQTHLKLLHPPTLVSLEVQFLSLHMHKVVQELYEM